MTFHSNIIRKVIHWVGTFLFFPEYISCELKEFPKQVDNGVIYIVCEGKEPETLIFKCPCGCFEIIYLNLLRDTRPCWEFKNNFFGLISIVPSVMRTVKCKSHFYITKGRVIHCANFTTY